MTLPSVLSQHYNGVHGNKAYECDRCGLKWGLKDVYKRHVKECGHVFQCTACDEQFKSSNALYQHNKRKHKVTRYGACEDRCVSQCCCRKKTVPIMVSPIVIKPLIHLASPHPCSTVLPGSVEQCGSYDLATQTDMTCIVDDLFDPSMYDHTHSDNHTFNTASERNMYNSDNLYDTSCDHTSASCDHHMYDTSTSCDFGTQTTTYDEQWIQDSSMGYLQGTDFGTQTLESAFDDIACLDFGTQTIFKTKDQGSQTK